MENQELLNIALFDAVSLVTSEISAIQEITNFSLYAIQYAWTGFSGTVVITLEATNDLSNQHTRTFSTVSSITLTGSTGNQLINIEKAGYVAIRLNMASTGGAGTLRATINAKV